MINISMKQIAGPENSVAVNVCTFAQVHIDVDGVNVTEHVGQDKEIHEDVHVSLYPLAYWIVSNWWCLNYEVQNLDRGIGSTYEERHRIRFGGEGYSLPNVMFLPTGGQVVIQSFAGYDKYSGNQYLNSAKCSVSLDDFKHAAGRIVEFVLDCLRKKGFRDEALEQEWTRINTLSDEENRFCILAALLGRDPFSLTDAEEQAILGATAGLNPELWDDFFSLASLEQLAQQVDTCKKDIRWVRSNATNNTKFKELQEAVTRDFQGSPWEQGYAAARHVRELLAYEAVPANVNDLMGLFGIGKRQQASVRINDYAFYHGLTAANRKGTPAFVVNSPRADQQKFIFSRLVYNSLFEDGGGVRFASSSRSDAQKRSRAFSAELIAPPAEIARRMPGPTVDYFGVERIASDMNVPSEVIFRQIQNHKLGVCQ